MAQFVHLHNHSDYSLLDGACSVASMVKKAKELGMPGLALTDHGNMYGSVRFYDLCKEQGINPIVGEEFYVAVGSRKEKNEDAEHNKYYHLILLAENETGYRNLCKLSAASFIEGYYYKPRIDDELLAANKEGLICSSACIAGEIPRLILQGKAAEAEKKAAFYSDLFGKDHFYLEIQDHGIPEQKIVNKAVIAMARKMNLPLIATNDMHYLNKDDAEAHDILLCIGTNKKLNDPNRMRFHGPEFYMKTQDEMTALFSEVPDALSNTLKVNEMVNLTITYPGPMLPDYKVPPEFSTKADYLRHLTYEGLKKRYPVITDEVKKRAEYELDIIIKMKFDGYYLIVWDFIHWSKTHDIPVGPGRGSGAGSIVAYAIAITDIDPLRYKLLFERFLNPERVSMPDFDVDFCFERRGEVIDYVTRHYGAENVGQIVTFGTLKAKAVIKSVARVLDIPFDKSNEIAKLVPEDPHMTLDKAIEDEPKLKALADDPQYKKLFEISKKLEGRNHHTSFHAAGIVIGHTKLTDYVPLFKEPKTGIVATQYTMDLIEKCGLVKMDFLGLKTLTLIKHTLDLIRRRGITIEESKIPEDDKKTYEMLGRGESTSVFQFESSGMQGILKQAQPSCMEDLIALNALYRPGPMAYIPQFIDSKFGRKPIEYPDPCLEPILKETYGVIVYQEQVMQVAQRIAGFTLGQADILRRAMGKKKLEVLMKKKEEFIAGAKKQGFTAEHADKIFEILIPFAGYGFNKSHAAAYSVVAYRTAYLKANYPAEFLAANLTNEISDSAKLTQYIDEARKLHIEVLPPNINYSEDCFSVTDGKIVYGFLGIKGVGAGVAKAIVEERGKNGPYKDFMDFIERMGTQNVNRKVLECLAMAGCFDEFGINRQQIVLNVERAMDYVVKKADSKKYGQTSLFENCEEEEFPPFEFEKTDEYPRSEILQHEKELLGFYFSGHPMDEFRGLWDRCCDVDLAHPEHASADKTYTAVAMLKEFREIMTKSGRKMAFGLIGDFNGSIEIVVFASTLTKFAESFVVDKVLCLRGKVDLSRDKPSFKVDEVLAPENLTAKAMNEVHLRLSPDIKDEEELYNLLETIYGYPGSCEVYLHVPRAKKTLSAGAGGTAGAAPVSGAGLSAGSKAGTASAPAAAAALDSDADDDDCGPVEDEPVWSGDFSGEGGETGGEGGGGADDEAPEKTPQPAQAAPSRSVENEVIIKANPQITCSSSEDSLTRLRLMRGVVEVWAN